MLFDGFVKSFDAAPKLCKKYSAQLPRGLTSVWEAYGFGTLLDGYLKIVNPEDYQDLLLESYALGSEAIPIMVTAFADVITWEKGRYLRLVKYREGVFQGISAGFNFFWEDLESGVLSERFFDLALYQDAVAHWGPLTFEQCFAFVPLLGLGGQKRADCVKKAAILEHIDLITQTFGTLSSGL